MNKNKKEIEEVGAGRRNIVESYRQDKAKWFQEKIDKNPYLAIQTALDPIGMLSKFGLIDPSDSDIYIRVIEGSLSDVVHLKEVVAVEGIAEVVKAKEKKGGRVVIHVEFNWIYIHIDIRW